MSEDTPLRIGVIGLGAIFRDRHVPGFRAVPGVSITAVCNRSRESSEKAAMEYGIPHVENSWEALVRRDDVDLVAIGTWPYTHREMSVAALEAGKHVFCQARMAMNYAEAKTMAAAAEASGKLAGLCPVPIGLSVDRTVVRMIEDGFIGEPRLVRVQSLSNAFADPSTPATWRKDHRLSGQNMHTLGMYIEVIHRWFGWTRAVSGSMQTFVPRRATPDGETIAIEIPDQVMINAEMETGLPVQYVISTVAPKGVDRIEIYGSRAMLRYDVANDLLQGAKPGEDFRTITIRHNDVYDVETWRVEQDFIEALRGGMPYRPNFEDGLRYMQVISGVYDSAGTGRVVDLSELA